MKRSQAAPSVVQVRPDEPRSSPYRSVAIQGAAWLASVASAVSGRVVWPDAPGQSASSDSLYHGSAGIILFFIELFRVTRDVRYLDLAVRGAGGLRASVDRRATVPSGQSSTAWNAGAAGLYDGSAGRAFALLELWKETRDDAHLALATQITRDVRALSRVSGPAAWRGMNDIVSGAAGIGLFLLRAADVLRDDSLIVQAALAGDYLIAQAQFEGNGCWWPVGNRAGLRSRRYPNFSHGTAGVAFFLSALAEKTGASRYLDHALAGAYWLLEHRKPVKRGMAWYRHKPGGTNLFYLGWCHGPAGTARLFYLLYRATGKQVWHDCLQACADWLERSGMLRRPLRGLWNLGMCCGVAGIGDFFASMYLVSRCERYRRRASASADYLVDAAASDGYRAKWVQAEHRDRPELQLAQTGYAQGAAGIGLFLLRVDGLYSQDAAPHIRLPDDPFPLQHS